MTRAEFEADPVREGYEIREGEIKPNEHRGAHIHDFDARLFVLDGGITLVFGDERCVYSPGDSCNVRRVSCMKSTRKRMACDISPDAAHRRVPRLVVRLAAK
jgi:hypothetical protein